jgi:hypothetical protein
MNASRRGNALITVMIGLAVLLMLVAAAIKFTGASSQASMSKAKADQLSACAVTAKRTLLSKLRTFGVPVTNLSLNTPLPDGLSASTQSNMLTGHYDATGPEPTIIKLESSAMGQSRKQLRDMSNTLSQTTLGGSYYRVVARCRSPVNGAESEVEFTFRHGI